MDGLYWKILLKWMIRGTPISGNLHLYHSPPALTPNQSEISCLLLKRLAKNWEDSASRSARTMGMNEKHCKTYWVKWVSVSREENWSIVLVYMGVYIVMEVPPIAGWFISWKMPLKWMRTGGTPISGNLHIESGKFWSYSMGEMVKFALWGAAGAMTPLSWD